MDLGKILEQATRILQRYKDQSNSIWFIFLKERLLATSSNSCATHEFPLHSVKRLNCFKCFLCTTDWRASLWPAIHLGEKPTQSFDGYKVITREWGDFGFRPIFFKRFKAQIILCDLKKAAFHRLKGFRSLERWPKVGSFLQSSPIEAKCQFHGQKPCGWTLEQEV